MKKSWASDELSACLQGVVSISFAASSVRSKKGPRVLVAAAQLIYTKQQAALPVMTTAAEYT